MPFAFNNAYIGEEDLTYDQKIDRGANEMASNMIPEQQTKPSSATGWFEWNDNFFTAVAFGLLVVACGLFYWTSSFCDVNPSMTTNLHIQSGLEQITDIHTRREQQEQAQT
jgi:hypothetical protein